MGRFTRSNCLKSCSLDWMMEILSLALLGGKKIEVQYSTHLLTLTLILYRTRHR